MATPGPSNPAPTESLNGILSEAIESKRKFDEFIAGATATVSQLIEKARNDGAEVDRLKTDVATLKGGVETAQTAAVSELGIITQAKSEVETVKSAATALSESVTSIFSEVSGKITELTTQQAGLKNILTDLTAIKAEAESEKDAVKESVAEIETVTGSFKTAINEATERQTALSQGQEALKGKIDEITAAHGKIKELQATLLENSEGAQSVRDQIGDLQSRITATLVEVIKDRDGAAGAIKKFNEQAEQDKAALFKSLEEKILALLPSAGAAGLAYTYYDAKSKYSPTSFAGRPGGVAAVGWRNFVRSMLSYNPSSLVATVIFYAMFFLPLAILAYGSFKLLQRTEDDAKFVLTYQMLALRGLVAVPLATISAFGFASLVLYRKLFEEYNHKQRVMELYESFKKEIDASGGSEEKKLLLNIMLNSVATKADTVKEEEKGEQTAFSKMEKWIALMTKFKAAS